MLERLRQRIGGAAVQPFHAVFLALLACAILPIWIPRYLPLLDIAQHLDAIQLWIRYSNPQWDYARFYELQRLPMPYWGYYFPVYLLGHVFHVEYANKIFLTAYAAALPAATSALAAQLGRSRWLAIFTFPLVYNTNFAYGFISFCLGMAVLVYAITILDRFLSAPGWRIGVALFVVSTALYFSHLLLWLFFIPVCALFCLCHLRLRPALLAFCAAAPSAIPAAITYFAGRAHNTPLTGHSAFKASYDGLRWTLMLAPTRVVTFWMHGARWCYLLMLALAAVWLLLVRAPRAEAETTPFRLRYRLELVIVLAALCYLLLPERISEPLDWWMLNGRFAAVAALFLCLFPTGAVEKRPLLLGAAAVMVAIYPIALAAHWNRFDSRAKDFRALLAEIPRGAPTLTLVSGTGYDEDADELSQPYLHFGEYAHLRAGGPDPYSIKQGFPMIERARVMPPAPPWREPERFDLGIHGRAYAYLLTYSEAVDHMFVRRENAARAPLVDRRGAWRLYRLPH